MMQVLMLPHDWRASVTQDSGFSYASPSPPGTPSGPEVVARQVFQSRHPEVGFAFRAWAEPLYWIAYWLDADRKARHLEAATLGELIDALRLRDEFGDVPL